MFALSLWNPQSGSLMNNLNHFSRSEETLPALMLIFCKLWSFSELKQTSRWADVCFRGGQLFLLRPFALPFLCVSLGDNGGDVELLEVGIEVESVLLPWTHQRENLTERKTGHGGDSSWSKIKKTCIFLWEKSRKNHSGSFNDFKLIFLGKLQLLLF